MLCNKILNLKMSDNTVNVWEKDKAARAVSSVEIYYQLQ